MNRTNTNTDTDSVIKQTKVQDMTASLVNSAKYSRRININPSKTLPKNRRDKI